MSIRSLRSVALVFAAIVMTAACAVVGLLASRRRLYALALAALVCAAGTLAPSAVAAQPECTFSQGFKTLHDAIPDVVGDCIGPEQPNGGPGYSAQYTTNGMLNWVFQTDPALNVTFFKPNADDHLRYSLARQDECIAGVYLASGVCITIDTTVPIPTSALQAGATAESICEQGGNVFIRPQGCEILRPHPPAH
jgi:hypothetical protein